MPLPPLLEKVAPAHSARVLPALLKALKGQRNAEVPASYLLKQLVEIKQGAESNGEKGRMVAEMMAMVAPLSEQDLADLAAYYASLK